ncbi:hypothetical protein CDAR_61401 [Caerostris darwini]|uniref:Uncharacterized protein n=1 Tax=Caerostris darwini TaxID=1538125 RepID=A0AAV4V1J0_9ARAC|nr:hypothetical protein CDAR_61401 [Caerostris darwini]
MYGNLWRRHVPTAISLFRIFQKRLNVPSEAKHQEGIERFPEEKGRLSLTDCSLLQYWPQRSRAHKVG